MKNVLKSIVIALLVVLALTKGLYEIFPQQSWINLRAVPSELFLGDFSGSYYLQADSIDFYAGTWKNNSAVKVSINGSRVREYNPEELNIEFIKGETPDSFPPTYDEDGILRFSLTIDKESNPIMIDGDLDNRHSRSILYIQRPYSGSYTINYADRTITTNEENEYKLEVYQSNDKNIPQSSIDVVFSEGTTINVKHGAYRAMWEYPEVMRTYINGREVPLETLQFLDMADFEFTPNHEDYMECYFDARKSDCIFNGTTAGFEGSFVGDGAVLKQTSLNVQREYDINFLQASAWSEDELRVKYGVREQGNTVQISGKATDVSVADVPIDFFMVFIYDNLTVIAFAILGTFVSTYIPMLISSEEEKKPKNNSAPQSQTKDANPPEKSERIRKFRPHKIQKVRRFRLRKSKTNDDSIH